MVAGGGPGRHCRSEAPGTSPAAVPAAKHAAQHAQHAQHAQQGLGRRPGRAGRGTGLYLQQSVRRSTRSTCSRRASAPRVRCSTQSTPPPSL